MDWYSGFENQEFWDFLLKFEGQNDEGRANGSRNRLGEKGVPRLRNQKILLILVKSMVIEFWGWCLEFENYNIWDFLVNFEDQSDEGRAIGYQKRN